jgi:serine/threonine-protein kinase
MDNLPTHFGKYQVTKVLGQGAMGIVYQGFDPVIERIVAIKVLLAHHCNGEHGQELSKRFKREAQAAARCLHQNIVAVFDYGSQDGQDYIVMEFVEGEELSHFLRSDQQLSNDEAIFITTSVLQALAAAHHFNIVHRDIKPANIILLNDGEVKVADFGVALLDQSDLTLVGNMVGTPNYMAPEGLRGETVTEQADIYSTGMVLLEMLTGARLSPQQLYTLPINEFIDSVFLQHPHISTPLQTVISKALAPTINERYKSAKAFIEAIEALDSLQAQVSATVVAKAGIQEKSKQLLELPEDVLAELKQDLATHLGPMASFVIKKASTQSVSAKEFMLQLSKHITNPDQRKSFINQASKTLAIDKSTTADPQTQPPTQVAKPVSYLSDNISKDTRQQLTAALTFYLGPVASHQIKRHIKQAQSYSQLCENLAALINDSNDRQQFLDKVNQLS